MYGTTLLFFSQYPRLERNSTCSLPPGSKEPTDMQFFLPSYVDRLIAAARLVLVASSLLAIWLDPHEPAEYAGLISAFFSGYFLIGLSWPPRVGAGPPTRPSC